MILEEIVFRHVGASQIWGGVGLAWESCHGWPIFIAGSEERKGQAHGLPLREQDGGWGEARPPGTAVVRGSWSKTAFPFCLRVDRGTTMF